MALAQEFELLDGSRHDRKAFCCGKEGPNDFLKTRAVKHNVSGLSSTFVMTDLNTSPPRRIAAYYTLANHTVTREGVPNTKNLPKSSIPVVLLAQLAVDTDYQRRGLGEKTLITALRHSVLIAGSGLPVIGVVLDVDDDDALMFYQKYEETFTPFTDNPMRLFAPIKVLSIL